MSKQREVQIEVVVRATVRIDADPEPTRDNPKGSINGAIEVAAEEFAEDLQDVFDSDPKWSNHYPFVQEPSWKGKRRPKRRHA